jgi:hypothetical protein
MLGLMLLGGRGRGYAAIAGAAIVALATAACTGSSASTRKPVVGGILGFDQGPALQHDTVFTGKIPDADSFFACGSSTATYAAEIVTAGPTNARVRYEWGDVVPGLQAYASGTVSRVHFGKNGDLPFTHPFGDDMTFDMVLDKPYAGLAQVTGSGLTGIPPGSLHTEIAEGLIPHGSDGDYLPGFTPKDGDRAAAYGPWIIDCGHDDYHTEIHPPSVIAFAHQDGTSTVSNVYSDPYVVTQLFNPDPSRAADLSDPSRLTDPDTLAFPQYVLHLILGMLGSGPPAFQGKDRLESHVLVDANRSIQGVTWYVCAPGSKPSGASLSVTSNFTARSGVDIEVTPNDDIGCAEVTATVTSSYQPQDVVRKDCVLDWNILNRQASAALMLPGLDVRKSLADLVPGSIRDKVERDPIVDCYDPLSAPPLGTSGKITVSDDQPYPFYGQVSVSWKS